MVEPAGRRPRVAGAERWGSKNTKAEEKKGVQTEAPRTLVEEEVGECLSSALSSLRFHHAGMPLPDGTPPD